jgi:acyl-CoA reductase-like NAD-dependent aldehyde dehydrogenase
MWLPHLPEAPFGGFKQSAMDRELGEYALHKFTVKPVTVKF